MANRRKKVILVAVAVVCIAVLAIVAYRRLVSLSLNDIYANNIAIYRLEYWEPQQGGIPVEIERNEGVDFAIYSLIASKRYYKVPQTHYLGDNVINIFIKGVNKSGDIQYCTFSISNRGDIEIRDLINNPNGMYTINDGNLFLDDKSELRELYNKIFELIHKT